MDYRIKGQYLYLTIDRQFVGKSIDDFFHYFHLSKKTIHLWKQNKSYALNNSFVSSNTILNMGDILKVLAFEDGIDFALQEYPLDIVYEDDFILIVNKKPGVLIYPATKDGMDTLCNYVGDYYFQTNQFIPVRPIHRLDVDTSGLIIFSKCAFLQPLLDYMMETRQIKRTYLAICKGIIKHDMVVDLPIGRHRHLNKMIVSDSGKMAMTQIKVVAGNKKDNYSVVECQLQTGRKHQIRVHLSMIGHPLLGDLLYGSASPLIKRLALHSYQLSFIHPLSNQSLKIVAKIPDDFSIFNLEKVNKINNY